MVLHVDEEQDYENREIWKRNNKRSRNCSTYSDFFGHGGGSIILIDIGSNSQNIGANICYLIKNLISPANRCVLM
jgi:hypothetical protein